MRILSVVHNLDPGGIQRTAQNFAVGYKKAGHDSAILAFERGGPRLDEIQNEGFECFIGDGKYPGYNGAIEKTVQWKPDILHVHRHGRSEKNFYKVNKLLKEKTGAKIVEKNSLAKPGPEEELELVDVHLVLSEWCLWEWQCLTRGIKPKPLSVVIPNIIDTDRFYPLSGSEKRKSREQYDIPEDAFVFGRIGNPHPYKWSPVLIDKFVDVIKSNPNTFLLLAGVPDDLRQKIDSLPGYVKEKIRVIDYIYGDDGLREFYGAMDVFLHLAHLGESFGNVIAESIACEIPVLTFSTPYANNCQVEIVQNNKDGIIVNNRNSITGAMQKMQENSKINDNSMSEGREGIINRYSRNVVVDSILRLFEYIISIDDINNLRNVIEKDSSFVTYITSKEIIAYQKKTSGKISPAVPFLLQLGYGNKTYRFWRKAFEYLPAYLPR